MDNFIISYNDGLATIHGIEYTPIAYELVDSQSIHMVFQNGEYHTVIYMAANSTIINGVTCTTTTQIIDLLGNPPQLNS